MQSDLPGIDEPEKIPEKIKEEDEDENLDEVIYYSEIRFEFV